MPAKKTAVQEKPGPAEMKAEAAETPVVAEKKAPARKAPKPVAKRVEKPKPMKPVWHKLKLPETQEGTVVFSVDPLIIKHHYEIDYIHSYAEDSKFFIGLTQKKLLGSECTKCHYRYATPRAYCMQCGARTKWIELPLEGRVHTWTTCYFGSEEFLKETPFNLILVEFDGVNTLFLSRLIGAREDQIQVGMKVRAQFIRNAKFKPTDVYFVPAE